MMEFTGNPKTPKTPCLCPDQSFLAAYSAKESSIGPTDAILWELRNHIHHAQLPRIGGSQAQWIDPKTRKEVIKRDIFLPSFIHNEFAKKNPSVQQYLSNRVGLSLRECLTEHFQKLDVFHVWYLSEAAGLVRTKLGKPVSIYIS